MELDKELAAIKKDILANRKGRDPFADPTSWDLINLRLPRRTWPLLVDVSGAAGFLQELPKVFPVDKFHSDTEAHLCWERIGNFYKNQHRYNQAIPIYLALYNHFIAAQNLSGKRIRKGTPLVWISDCYMMMNYPVLSKRCLMLALCENAVHEKGDVPPQSTGTYWRLIINHGLPDSELKRYAKIAYELHLNNPEDTFFPEWIVQRFDKGWMTEVPFPMEAGVYWANGLYIKRLISKLGDGTGRALETLADYILSCMPGCRTMFRKQTASSEFDVVCSMDGIEADFRSELGRYFVCECKDLTDPASFTTIAKFCRVLDSIKSRFGILFSPKGISGEKGTKYAERERLKIYQDRGIVLVVIKRKDLQDVADGGNFINLLRDKYEKVRLDLLP